MPLHLPLNFISAFDESIRCRASGICDTPPGTACDAGPDSLGCETDASARRAAVVRAIQGTWRSYVRCAWGHDELKPITCGHSDWIGLGLTLVDGLDTLLLAGLQEVSQHCLLFAYYAVQSKSTGAQISLHMIFVLPC